MERLTIIDTVNTALAEEFELDTDLLTPQTHLRDDLNLDSLDYVDMVIVLEKAFHFKIEDKQQLVNIRTLGDVYDFIEAMRDKGLVSEPGAEASRRG